MIDNSISIVIPCYNGWTYMAKCLESLENQSMLPDSIIIVDDCSTDDSVERIEEYASHSKLNIQIIKNIKNVGPGQSRANAINYINTEFVSFCDCDDWYELTFIEDIKKIISNEYPDLIIFDNYIISNSTKTKAEATKQIIGKTKPEIIALYAMALWRFTVSTRIIKSVSFPPLFNGEDAAVAPQIIALSNKTLILENAYYNYLYRFNSGSMVISDRVYKNMIEAFNVVHNELSREFNQECEFIGIKNVIYAASFNAIKAGVSNKTIKEFINDFAVIYPKWINNPYITSLSTIKKIYIKFINRKILFFPRIIANLHKLKYRQKG